jgi:hypothetical protein
MCIPLFPVEGDSVLWLVLPHRVSLPADFSDMKGIFRWFFPC